jgi:IS5 family transposase
MLTAIGKLRDLAKEHGVPLRQSYVRVAKRAALMVGRYAHAKQFRRCNRALKLLRTRLGRLIRDIGRKTERNAALRKVFAGPLVRANLMHRKRIDRLSGPDQTPPKDKHQMTLQGI